MQLCGFYCSASFRRMTIPTVTWSWRERGFIPNTVPHPSSPTNNTQLKKGEGVAGWCHYWCLDGQLMNRTRKTTGVRIQSASRIKKGHTHTLTWPATIHWHSRHGMLSQTSLLKMETQHTPLHSTLKDQSQPSPRIQDHTVAAVGERLDWGREDQSRGQREEKGKGDEGGSGKGKTWKIR